MHIVWRKRDVPCSNGVEVEQDGKESRFGISYDALGRYTGCADFKNPRLYERFGYDEMGNITTMQHCTPQGIVNAMEFACDGNVSLSESRGQTDDKPRAISSSGAASAEPSPGLSYAESRQRKTKSSIRALPN